MQWLEMHNVEYGECLVLGGSNREILMVDCGSMNQKIREGDMLFSDYANLIASRYAGMKSRAFLLTHYHRDHLCGFQQILHMRPVYFQRIYLPFMPTNETGGSPLVEFALFAHAFLQVQTLHSQVNTSCLRVFQNVSKGIPLQDIFTLQRGSQFSFDNSSYEVLWPPAQNYPYSDLFLSCIEEMKTCLANPFLSTSEQRFSFLHEKFCLMYAQCCYDFSVEHHAGLSQCEADIQKLSSILEEIDILRPALVHTGSATRIREILNRPITRSAYTEAANSASVVFHNIRRMQAEDYDILLTGDASSETISQIEPDLYSDYYIVKAPHHGTSSGYSSILAQIGTSHVLISNGNYHAAGSLYKDYLQWQSIRHCTNTSQCKWILNSECCCNRLESCYDQAAPSGLAIRCKAANGISRNAECGIYTLGPLGQHSCFCDI